MRSEEEQWERERTFAELRAASGAVVPEGPSDSGAPSGEWQELVAASAAPEVCDHSEGRALPPEVISFLRCCAGCVMGGFFSLCFKGVSMNQSGFKKN